MFTWKSLIVALVWTGVREPSGITPWKNICEEMCQPPTIKTPLELTGLNTASNATTLEIPGGTSSLGVTTVTVPQVLLDSVNTTWARAGMFPVLLTFANRLTMPGVCVMSLEKYHLAFSGHACRWAVPVLKLSKTVQSAAAKTPSLVKFAFGPIVAGMLVSTPPPELCSIMAFVRVWLVAPSFIPWQLI